LSLRFLRRREKLQVLLLGEPLPEEPLRVLMVGRFAEKKGFPDGLRAFAQFLERGGSGQVTIVGGRDAPGAKTIERALREIIRKNELKEYVDFRGFVAPDELRETYRKHRVLLSPSVGAESGDNEGGAPVTLIEAQATGLPVVSTYHRDIPEVVQDGETGLLVPEHDCSELARHLLRLFQNPELLGRWAGRHDCR
jgi:colanic acid/amylovoran biosynthesis glycosyltransferase